MFLHVNAEQTSKVVRMLSGDSFDEPSHDVVCKCHRVSATCTPTLAKSVSELLHRTASIAALNEEGEKQKKLNELFSHGHVRTSKHSQE